MPRGAPVLTAQLQREVLTIWALCDFDAPKEDRTFVVYGTGETIQEPPGDYIGTVQDGSFVWHVFEEKGGER
jgi:hypothetical protein